MEGSMKQKNDLKIIEICRLSDTAGSKLPAFSSSVQAGFPSPADDYIEKELDLNELMVGRPAATFFVRVEGDSMKDALIQSGDILVVDRSLEPCNGKIVIAVYRGEFTVKRFQRDASGIWLVPENPAYPRLRVEEGSDFEVWGVVTYVIHRA
jgi:DNA polymerase V